MWTRVLGRTGVTVSEYCLGAMMLGAWGNPDHDECIRLVHRALDAGINFIDTADVYSGGESEEIVGKALKGRRDDVVLASEMHYRWATVRTTGAIHGAGSSPRSRTPCAACRPITSTSTRSTAPTRRSTWRRLCRPCPT